MLNTCLCAAVAAGKPSSPAFGETPIRPAGRTQDSKTQVTHTGTVRHAAVRAMASKKPAKIIL